MPDIFETTDAAASSATPYSLAVGQTARASVGVSGDRDWFSVTLEAGKTYSFAQVGEGHANEHLHSTNFQLRSADGTAVGNGVNGPGTNSRLTYTAQTSGTYYIDAGSGNGGVGAYGVSVTEGTKAHYDELMGAGVLLRPDRSWSTPGTAATVTWAARLTDANATDAQGNPTNTFTQISDQQIATITEILSMYAEVSNVTFQRVNAGGYSDDATMLFSNYRSTSDGAGAYAYYPGSAASDNLAGDVRMNSRYVDTASQPTGGYSYFAIMHEVGHAMGLAHPGDYNAAPGVSITYNNSAQFREDTQQYSVMSYFDESNTTSSYGSYADGLMLFDILALQQLYGANTTTRTGDTVYGFGSTAGAKYDFAIDSTPALAIWDAGGTDTLNGSGFAMSQVIDLRAGNFSNIGGLQGNVAIAIGAVIENAVGGSGDDTIIGNAAGNRLTGGAGADTLKGLGGNDVYILDRATDTVIEAADQGQDTVYANFNYILGAGVYVELLATGNGDGTNNVNLTGNQFAQTITGNAGANRLDGKGGADTLRGLGGDDVYVVDQAGDRVIETSSAGKDTVYAGFSYQLTAGAEVEVLATGNGSGTDSINLTGNEFAQTITGNSGANRLDGKGGADTLRGLGGDDVYVLDQAGDRVVETVSNGIDTVFAGFSYILTEGADVENLATGNASGTGSINLTGNEFSQNVMGNAGANVLDGKLGSDSLEGFGGNDMFLFSSALGGGNIDTIRDFARVSGNTDKIAMDDAIFGLSLGALASGAFASNGTGLAGESNDRIIYNSSTGSLWFDANGDASGGGVQFAVLSGRPSIGAGDFIVV